jgi:cytochrome c oxidase cbb3-type subunit 4
MPWLLICKSWAFIASNPATFEPVVFMDINLLRSIVTVVMFVFFIGVTLWAWSARNRKGFDDAARLPFEGE